MRITVTPGRRIPLNPADTIRAGGDVDVMEGISLGGELVFTAPMGTPLIRYNIHDTGGILPCAELLAQCRARVSVPKGDRRR